MISLQFTGKQLNLHIFKTGCLLEPFVQTSLISFYNKYKLIDDTHKVFDEIHESHRLNVSYNALIYGYVLNFSAKDVMILFNKMRELGLAINESTIFGLVPLCGVSENLELGMYVHYFCVKFILDVDIFVGNCLLTMYANCGEVNFARKLFNNVPGKQLIT